MAEGAVLLLLSLSLLLGVHGSLRTLQVSIHPVKPPITQPFDPNLALNSPDLPSTDTRVVKKTAGCEQPEQVHVTYWSSTAVLVSWASCDAELGELVNKAAATDNIRSVVYYGSSRKNLQHTAEGVATSYANTYEGIGTSYASPILHHVLLKGLQPGVTYHYKVADTSGSTDGEAKLALGRKSGTTHSFTLPKPGGFPLRIGVIGDPGQTYNTSETLARLTASDPQLLLLLGDFSYADNWVNNTQLVPWQLWGTLTYQPKWDTWGRLWEPLLSRVPLMHTNGNHEREPLNDETQNAYNHRYPTPQVSGHDYTKGPMRFDAASAAQPFTNLYYTVELPGVYKYIALTSYAPGQTFSADEEQYTWLEKELQQVDRRKTPWVLVAVHAPFYHTYQGHFKEVECMRQAYEPLFVKYQVDLVMSGHVHSYERTKPLVNYQVNEDGPMYLTVGDGGNIEGIYKDYIDDTAPDFCFTPERHSAQIFPPSYQPQVCFSWQDGEFCPQQQPDWSAYREPSFGFGTLELLSPTTAKWTWRKNQWPKWEVADEVMIFRGGNQKVSAEQGVGAGAGKAVPAT